MDKVKYPLRDSQTELAALFCARCGVELYKGETGFKLPEGICCEQCFSEWVEDLLDTSHELIAEQLGVEHMEV